MWSLFKKGDKKEKSETFYESLNSDHLKSASSLDIFDYSNEGEELKPMQFSNGKTQADVVQEVLSEIEKGTKIIFIKGVCGTGKSAIALNLARHFQKTAIVVPIKSLQEQYENDYTRDKFILKKDKNKLRIAVIKGRQNFSCPFSASKNACDFEELPCLIEIREKNMDKIMEYIKQNKDVNKNDFANIHDVKRMSIAPICPYWSPLLPADISSEAIKNAKKKKYKAVSGKDFALFQRKKGCAYYDQYEHYIDSDVLIFNSQKYLIEMAIKRKPKTDLDIIDECDEFLDNFSQEKTINLSRLHTALSNLFPSTREEKETIKSMIHLLNDLIYDKNLASHDNSEIEKLEKTKYQQLIDFILENPYLAEDEENNYYNSVFETAKSFESVLSDTYASCFKEFKSQSKLEPSVLLSLVTINLAKRFLDIIENNSTLVLMSGTLHSPEVLRDIFGLKNFKVIDAESQTPGIISKFRTGMEKNCKYENFKNGIITRGQYLKALSNCVEQAKSPVLVHVNSFSDLPSQLEKFEYNLQNLPLKEELIEQQNSDRNNRQVQRFKDGKIPILFTTKCSRGVDFPGEKCNSIIITRFPYPDISSLFWKILRKEQPDKFREFYLDKANRELLQKIYRGLRFKDDHIILLSPDSRVIDFRFDK